MAMDGPALALDRTHGQTRKRSEDEKKKKFLESKKERKKKERKISSKNE